MITDPDCIFCKIVAGTVPCFKLFEDEDTLAFMDINPVHDGHCLVIPKAHYPNVFEIAPEAFAAAARTTISSLNDHRSSSEPPPRASSTSPWRSSTGACAACSGCSNGSSTPATRSS